MNQTQKKVIEDGIILAGSLLIEGSELIKALNTQDSYQITLALHRVRVHLKDIREQVKRVELMSAYSG